MRRRLRISLRLLRGGRGAAGRDRLARAPLRRGLLFQKLGGEFLSGGSEFFLKQFAGAFGPLAFREGLRFAGVP